MIQGKQVLAIIPARSGSKGLPNKNILDFLGKPLLAWSVEASIKSKYIDKTIISTDSKLFAEIGKKFGAEVPFMRPESISNDFATSVEVVEHTIKFMKMELDYVCEILVLLEPTSPLRTATDVDRALEKLVSNPDAHSLVSVGRVESQFPDFQFKETDNGFLTTLKENSDFSSVRRQEIAEHYFLDGSLYMAYIDQLLKNRSFVSNKTIGFLLPKWKNIEIDDEYDYEMALALGQRYL
jgi:N-acylneuraminate cytidylyltransferase/CMP-N,N'-diacetyllegionaminic acid synthase